LGATYPKRSATTNRTTKETGNLPEKLSRVFPDLKFNDDALAEFLLITDHGAWEGRAATEWLKDLNRNGLIVANDEAEFCSRKLDRKGLLNYCRANTNSNLAALVAVMAWGRMKVKHGRLALDDRGVTRGTVLKLVHQIRTSTSDRAADYKRFYEARRNGSLEGIGPAYYTKLLFFLRPDRTAYILDQWTAKSIHVLTSSRQFPKLNGAKGVATVSDRVTPDDYEKYCLIVDNMAAYEPAGWTGPDVEERMFSQGGRDPKHWRQYVKEHWPPKLLR
jgi:Putative 8-oxoguanine DNA glycosylase OGG-like protein